MNLYKIDLEYLKLMELLDESDGEITEEVGDLMEQNQNLAENSLKNYTFMVRNLEGDINAIDAEIKRLTAMKKSKDRSLEVLKDGITFTMKVRDLDKFDGGTFKLSFRKSTSLVIDDEGKVPEQFLKLHTTIDKQAIKDTLKGGFTCTYAHLQENDNLQIK